MADVVLRDGRELAIDLKKISLRQYAFLRANLVSDEEAYALMGKVIDLPAEELAGLSRNDQASILLAILTKGSQPLADPKLPKPSGEV